MLSLNSVEKVTATHEPDVFVMLCNITDVNGETYDCSYCSRPDDTFGLNPTIRQWLNDNAGSYVVEPYVPPTPDEARAAMRPLTRVAFRTAFKNAGMTTATITAAIFSVEDESLQEDMQIAWEDSIEFKRLDPVVLLIAERAAKTPEQIDTIWLAALAA